MFDIVNRAFDINAQIPPAPPPSPSPSPSPTPVPTDPKEDEFNKP